MDKENYKTEIANKYMSGFTNDGLTKYTMECFPELDYRRASAKMRASLDILAGEGKIIRRKNGEKSSMAVKSTGSVSIVKTNSVAKDAILDLLKNGITYEELSEKCSFSIDIVKRIVAEIKSSGYNVVENGDFVQVSNIIVQQDNRFEDEWGGNHVIRFGLMGDTQINSKYTQLTHLHTMYAIYKQEGIETVYHTGDIDEGEQMRPGHQYECYTQGADDHVKEIVRVYPKIDGITTKFITGNHDASMIKRCGLDIGYQIVEKRPDMVYLGQSNAIINLTPKCTLELRHPIDGTSYALSYKMQKMVDAMSGGEKPNILAVGHYHKSEYLMYRNIHCFQTASFQAQTPFMKGKGISASVGGWIIEINVDDDGTITKIKQEYIPFYKSIKDDYLNFR